MSTTETTKTLAEMTQEVLEWCRSKGWYDKPVSFAEAMALLHTEIAEASDAWRNWGADDATCDSAFLPDELPKPEGIGSEFADVLTRLLDDCGRFGVDLQAEAEREAPEYVFKDSFLENMNTLHFLVARAYMAHQAGSVIGPEFACIYAFVQQCSAKYGIDLHAEYARKMTYNRTRPYRHGKRQ